MSNNLKNNIRKYIRKYITVVFSLLLIPCLSFNAFAYTSDFPIYPYNLKRMYVSYIKGSTVSSTSPVSAGDHYIYNHSASYSSIDGLSYIFYSGSEETDRWFTFPVNTDIYDYYIVGSLVSNLPQYDINISNIRINSNSDLNFYIGFSDFKTSDVDFLNSSSGTSFSAKLNSDDLEVYSSIYSLDLLFPSPYTASTSTYYFQFAVIYLEKDLSAGAVSDILQEIQLQNDLIENGDEDTQSAVSDFNQVFDDFNEELENWEQFDDEIIGEFNSANDDYMSELNNFSLSGSLLNAGNWLSTSMQTVYDNSSDYKMLWLVPLLFGIPILLFIIRKTGDDE